MSLTLQMLDRQNQVYGRYPLKVALDGGFASKDNLHSAKGKGIKDFKHGLNTQEEEPEDKVKSDDAVPADKAR